ncbi:MAG TPA: hypothetical protein PK720_02810 [bacterium]|nr:hypothetical protein [bacterium]
MSKKILITGIPGMGKTTVGEYLSKYYNFIHWDVEKDPERSDLITQLGNIVITWGFPVKDENIEIIEKLRINGFDLIWFDGDREAARREFVERDSKLGMDYFNSQLELLEKQLQRIKDSNVIERLKPRIINTFNREHKFRNIKDIVDEILI